jgi:uncharacterized membrane protein
MHGTTAITINRSPTEVYRCWRDLENLPTFMYHLESVEQTGNGRSHWKAKAPAGSSIEWDAEIVQDEAGKVIAWRSVEGSSVESAGSVHFTPAPANQGTEVVVELDYSPPGGALGAAVAKLFGEEPVTQMKDDLRRFKQVLETGEVVRSEGNPDGAATPKLIGQREAQPVDERGGSSA